jgi:hypothetical protein
LLDALIRNGALDAGHFQPGQHLLPIIGFPPAVVLYNRERGGFHIFVGRVPLAAFQALTTAADSLPVAAGTGIDHLVFIALAVGAFHGKTGAKSSEYTPKSSLNQQSVENQGLKFRKNQKEFRLTP